MHDVAVFDLNGDGWDDMILGRCTGTEIYMNVPPIGLTFSYPLGLPLFVKPANMGSSIGVTKAHDRAEVEGKINEIETLLGPACHGHDVLYSTKILKKTGLRLRRAEGR